MKHFLFIIMSLSISYCANPNETVKSCREYYYSVCLNETDIQDFSEYLELHKNSKELSVQGYQSVVWFLWADYYINPIQKWKCFKKGKENLEKLIVANKENVELRFLRLTIQENLPALLGYSDNKKEDKEFIFNRINNISDNDLKIKIVQYLRYNSMAKTN